ncbi:hypothetical protein EDD86DRAFT_187801 [Gorgonomyces haynaldii]|nr:hypothetical protein EDD86DRAFT_187801 [Gorgonomyces haynaldii]
MTQQEFEQHYLEFHAHQCQECLESFATNHLLSLHLMEQHDSFFSVLSEKKPCYKCFVEWCPKLHWTAAEREKCNHAG